jgi:hypothetical protein
MHKSKRYVSLVTISGPSVITTASPISRVDTSVRTAGGSLAERWNAHQRPGLDEHRGAAL